MAKVPLELTLRDIPNSMAIEERVEKKVDKLTSLYSHIEFCKVVIELSQKHKHQGKLFTVLIEVGVPGKRLVANHKVDEDLYVVLRDTFDAMKRQIEEYSRRQRGDVKTHLLAMERIEGEEARD